jgi:hypothetical protein
LGVSVEPFEHFMTVGCVWPVSGCVLAAVGETMLLEVKNVAGYHVGG